jgi:hypothetical protein
LLDGLFEQPAGSAGAVHDFLQPYVCLLPEWFLDTLLAVGAWQ